MFRTQQLLIPAVLVGFLTVILLTNLVFQPEKVNAATFSDRTGHTGAGADLLASFSLETTTEVPTQTISNPAGKTKSNKKSSSQSNNSNHDANNSTPPDSSSDCTIAASYPAAVRQWCNWIDNYAQAQNLDPNLIAAVILEESGGNAQAYSSSGAVGLMQIMPRMGWRLAFPADQVPVFLPGRV